MLMLMLMLMLLVGDDIRCYLLQMMAVSFASCSGYLGAM